MAAGNRAGRCISVGSGLAYWPYYWPVNMGDLMSMGGGAR